MKDFLPGRSISPQTADAVFTGGRQGKCYPPYEHWRFKPSLGCFGDTFPRRSIATLNEIGDFWSKAMDKHRTTLGRSGIQEDLEYLYLMEVLELERSSFYARRHLFTASRIVPPSPATPNPSRAGATARPPRHGVERLMGSAYGPSPGGGAGWRVRLASVQEERHGRFSSRRSIWPQTGDAVFTGRRQGKCYPPYEHWRFKPWPGLNGDHFSRLSIATLNEIGDFWSDRSGDDGHQSRTGSCREMEQVRLLFLARGRVLAGRPATASGAARLFCSRKQWLTGSYMLILLCLSIVTRLLP